MFVARRKALLRQILEADLSGLLTWRRRVLPDAAIQTYVEVLIHYLKRETNLLANVARYISFDECPELYWLANTRVQILAGSVNAKYVLTSLRTLPKQSPWWPEILFVAGLALRSAGELAEAKRKLVAAADALENSGAVKKAAKAQALVNALELDSGVGSQGHRVHAFVDIDRRAGDAAC